MPVTVSCLCYLGTVVIWVVRCLHIVGSLYEMLLYWLFVEGCVVGGRGRDLNDAQHEMQALLGHPVCPVHWQYVSLVLTRYQMPL